MDVSKSYIWRGGTAETSLEISLRFLVQLIYESCMCIFPLGGSVPVYPGSQQTEKRMPCRKVDPTMEQDAPAAARVLLSLSIACWAGRMDPALPDIVQHGPLLALTFKPRQQHIVFPLTV